MRRPRHGGLRMSPVPNGLPMYIGKKGGQAGREGNWMNGGEGKHMSDVVCDATSN